MAETKKRVYETCDRCGRFMEEATCEHCGSSASTAAPVHQAPVGTSPEPPPRRTPRADQRPQYKAEDEPQQVYTTSSLTERQEHGRHTAGLDLENDPYDEGYDARRDSGWHQ